MKVKESDNVQLSVAIPKDLYESIEKQRGEVSRSGYIREALKTASEAKENGVVYTPEKLAEYVASKVFVYYKMKNTNGNQLTVLDPACGDGELLTAISKTAGQYYNLQLLGVDIDKKALTHAKGRLQNTRSSTKLMNTNGLCPYNQTSSVGWKNLLSRLDVKNDSIDIILANPPWGANTKSYTDLIKKSNFTLNAGQVDSSDLFIESALNIVRDGGFIAFIIPDSLFSQERVKLRELLLKNTNIHFIGRFGEKIFKDINRACAVVICQKTLIPDNSIVDCFRLTPEERNLILAGKTTFHDAELKLSHQVPQNRFLKNNDYLLNIDLNSELEKTYEKISLFPHNLGSYLNNARGVELSKKGKIFQCSNCTKWAPYSKNISVTCKYCKKEIFPNECVSEVIIQGESAPGFSKIIVGESIQRYRIASELWIDTEKEGINYKSIKTYLGHKILVRKTGVGISASIDYSESLTNQVVYIFKLIDKKSRVPLEFFLFLINSRVAFFYTTMIHGENEWRTHPYITQKQVLNIPIPDISKLNDQILQKINLLSLQLKENLKLGKVIPVDLDARLEQVVAEIYQLNYMDYEAIYKSINNAQELIPMKTLKKLAIADIFPRELIN